MVKTLYSIFIGLLLVTFVGVGVAAFYPAPEPPEFTGPYLDEEGVVEPESELTVPYNTAYEQYEFEMEAYARNVTLILVASALVILILCLTIFRALPVIADGLLLGGVFTLIYGIGWSFAAGDKQFIFLVVSIGLAVALALGYIKFIRPLDDKQKQQLKKTKN